MELRPDVAVVGGGIAGGAMAFVLARAGLDVVVIERQTTYRDRVRGEAIPNWGVAEILALGLEQTLLDAGAGYNYAFVNYDEVLPAPNGAPITEMLPGTRGFLNVGHPAACQALTEAARDAGARLDRGVSGVEVTLRPTPTLTYLAADGTECVVRPRLVVGADGRHSIVRKCLDRELIQTPVRMVFGGMLVDEVDWPPEESAIGTEGDLHFLVFPRPNGLVRLYLGRDVDGHPELSGPGSEQAFLENFRFDCMPASKTFAKARVVAPCAFYPSFDTWVERPYGRNAVLVGDAGGWTDPLIGQGISISFRDVHLVSDILTGGDDWSPEAFSGYGEERAERLRRICVSTRVTWELRCRHTPEFRARRLAYYEAVANNDALALGPIAATIVGPDALPAEVFSLDNIDRILAFGLD